MNKFDWKTYVDKIYIINCTKYSYKRESLFKELERIDVDFSLIKIVEDVSMSKIYKLLMPNFTDHSNSKCMNSTAFNAVLMFYYCMKHASDNNYSKILILEDDIKFLKNINLLYTILEKSKQVFNDNNIPTLFLGNTTVLSKDKYNNQLYNKIYDTYICKYDNYSTTGGAAFTIYNKLAYEGIINIIENLDFIGMDEYYLFNDFFNVDIYYSPKHICLQESWKDNFSYEYNDM